MGSGSLTIRDQARWGAGTAGQRLSKNFAPYWEVFLDSASAEQLQQYDVLLLPIMGVPRLTTSEREKIRRFLDKGGVLWVDLTNAASIADTVNSIPGPFVVENSGVTQLVSIFHPLMSSPNQLSVRDLSLASDSTSGFAARRFVPGDLSGNLVGALGGLASESNEWDPVAVTVANTNLFTIATQKIGDGYFVLTTRGISQALNLTSSGGPNQGFQAGTPSNNEVAVAAQKIAVNIINLAANYTSPGGGGRNDNSVAKSVQAPAIKRFTAETPFAFTGPTGVGGDRSDTSTPVLFNGRVITTQGDRVVVYDSLPNRNFDRDSSGNPDDGFIDPVPGEPEDIIWYSQSMGSKLSSPTVIENPGSAFGDVEQVWVRDANSNVYVFSLNSGGADLGPVFTVAPPGNTQPLNDAVTPVTHHEGLVFINDYQTDNTGRVWVVDAKTGSKAPNGLTDWGVYSVGGMGRPTAAPTVGYITIDDNSGGNDRVVYVGSAEPGTQAPTISSLWIGAKGENPRTVNQIGNTLRVNTRASDRRLPIADIPAGSPGALVVRMIDNAGNFATITDLQTYISGVTYNSGSNGILDIELTGAGAALDWSGGANSYFIRLDYTIDWSGPSGGTASAGDYVRGNLTLVDNPTTPSRTILGSPAMTPNGFLGVSVSTVDDSAPGANGTFYILKEKGRGEFLVRTRFDLHDRISGGIAVRGGATFPYPESIIDEDNLTTAIPFLNGEISDLKLVGAPAITDDLMFVTATGTKTLTGALAGIPAEVSVLLAFEAEPAIPELVLTASTADDAQLRIRQPDLVKSSDQTTPAISGTLGAGSFSVEPISGTDQVRVLFESLASTTRSTISACLANNLPLLVEWGDSTEVVVEPEGPVNGTFFPGFSGGTFNTLEYYIVLNGYQMFRNPVATGDVVYTVGTSILPDILAGVPFGSWGRDGLLYAIDSDVSPNDPFLVGNSARPWQNQYWTINGVTAPFNFDTANPSTNLKWPQLRGIRSIDDLRIRLLQTRVDGPAVYGMAAGDDAIAVTYDESGGGDGLAVFSQSDFLVVDSGRMARIDPSGNPLWSLERTLYAGPNEPVGAGSLVRPLAEPSRMYPDGGNGFVYVDPGNNVVAQVDGSGREIRTISDIKVHPLFRPEGMSTSAVLTLRRPQDATFWTTFQDPAVLYGPGGPFEGEVRLNGTPDQERWDHWLIADTANNRVIEVVDRYRVVNGRILGPVYYQDVNGEIDSGGNRWTEAKSVAFWHTPSQFSGKNYAYSSVSRQVLPDATQPNGSRLVFALGFNNVEPGLRSVGLDSPGNRGARDNPSGYGGVIIFDGDQRAIVSEFTMPPIVQNTYIRDAGGGTYAFNFPTSNQPAIEDVKIAGLRSVTTRQVVDPGGQFRTAVMLAMEDGVYELWNLGSGYEVRWMLPRDAYIGMRRPNSLGPFSTGDLASNPADFRPMYARRLDSGDVLIVNGYTGSYLDGNFSTRPFSGEVFLVDGSFSANTGTTDLINPGYNLLRPNLGFNSLSVTFELPPVQGIRGIVRPVFAERQ